MILVTGGTGHIGNVLVRKLIERGEQVRLLMLPEEPHEMLDDLDGIDYVIGNVLDTVSLVRAMAGVKLVYHLAGVISIMPGDDQKVWQVNVEGTRNVIAACREAGVGRLVYTSSIHAFKRVSKEIVVDETTPLDTENTVGIYDRSKAAATKAVLQAAAEGLDAVVVCPTGVIGPYDYRSSEMGQLIRGLLGRGPHILVRGAYDFVDVRDVADGLILAAEKGQSGEVYILSGEQISLVEMHRLVSEITHEHSDLWLLPDLLAKTAAAVLPYYYRMMHQTPRFTPYAYATITGNSLYNPAKARRVLGYKPRRLADTFADTIAWIKHGKPISVS